MLHVGRARHPGPVHGSVSRLSLSMWVGLVINCGKLIVSQSGRLLAKIRSLFVGAGVGVISLGGAPLSAPSLVTAEFSVFFRLGRAHEGYSSYWRRTCSSSLCRLWLSGVGGGF